MSPKTLFLIGAGPKIGRALATLFSLKRYDQVALFARRAQQLDLESAELDSGVKVYEVVVDVTDTKALHKALDDAEEALGKPECILYNAARVRPSSLLTEEVAEIDYDLK